VVTARISAVMRWPGRLESSRLAAEHQDKPTERKKRSPIMIACSSSKYAPTASSIDGDAAAEQRYPVFRRNCQSSQPHMRPGKRNVDDQG
jgi:hypothetical protein